MSGEHAYGGTSHLVEEDGWRPFCACGWDGPECPTEAAALEALRRHQRHPVKTTDPIVTHRDLYDALRGKVCAVSVEDAVWVRISHSEAWRVVKALRERHVVRIEYDEEHLPNCGFLTWERRPRQGPSQ